MVTSLGTPVRALASALALLLVPIDAMAQAGPFPWAYPVSPPGVKPPVDDGALHGVPGSTAAFSRSRLRDLFDTPDWHPGDHAPMPEIVSRGRKPDAFACAYCHLPSGHGRPENASLAGLPAGYIVQQMADFKSGARRTAVPERLPSQFMSRVAVAARDDEVAAAAAYFAALKPRSFLRVVETAQVPRTRVTAWIVALLPAGGTEPIGQRIVEVPEDLERFELRDGRATFVAYVPPGSITRGKDLVSTGGEGKTLACALCHGTDLKGVGLVPGIAGRSPSYVVRQLHDFRVAARAGPGAEQMKPVVDGLGDGDLLSIAAFLATLEP